MKPVTRKTLAYALAVPPLVWLAQGTIGWFVAEEACPHKMAKFSFGVARTINGVLGLVAVAVTIAAIVIAQRAVSLPTDASGPPKAPGEVEQRARYVAVWVVIVGVTLGLGLIMFSLPSLMLRACGETR